jgi:TolB-like protein
VLPFSNLGDERHEYFGDGLHEELISQLGGLCRGRVGVLARWSSLVFKGTSLRARDVGEALRADYLLEGSVRHEDDRVRITARLVETASETQLWAEMYDRHLTHCLTVQADVAAHIARALAAELVPDERARTQSAAASAAYQAYLKGRYFWNKTEDQALDQAIAYYEEALALDASFGPAAAALARAKVARAEHYREVPRLALASARDAARRALDIDPVAVRGASRAGRDAAHARLRLEHRRKRATSRRWQLNPSSESAHRGYAMLLSALGRHREAVRESDKAIELDPLCLVVGGSAAWVAYAAGDYPAAIEIARNTIDMDPSSSALAACWRGLPAVGAPRRGRCGSSRRRPRSPTIRSCWRGWRTRKPSPATRATPKPVVARMLTQTGYRQHYALAVAYVGLGPRRRDVRRARHRVPRPRSDAGAHSRWSRASRRCVTTRVSAICSRVSDCLPLQPLLSQDRRRLGADRESRSSAARGGRVGRRGADRCREGDVAAELRRQRPDQLDAGSRQDFAHQGDEQVGVAGVDAGDRALRALLEEGLGLHGIGDAEPREHGVDVRTARAVARIGHRLGLERRLFQLGRRADARLAGALPHADAEPGCGPRRYADRWSACPPDSPA